MNTYTSIKILMQMLKHGSNMDINSKISILLFLDKLLIVKCVRCLDVHSGVWKTFLIKLLFQATLHT